jgi:hypothetical protein
MDTATSNDPEAGLTAVVTLRQLLEVLEELHVSNARAASARLTPDGHEVPRLAFVEACELGRPCLADERVLLVLLRHGTARPPRRCEPTTSTWPWRGPNC